MAHQEAEFNVRGELDFEDVIKGDTFNYILEVTDENDNPVDYSAGTSMELTIYEAGTNIVALKATSGNAEIDFSSSGEIAFDVDASKMNELEARRYEYDIVFEDSNGAISTEFGGNFKVVLGRVR